MADLRKTAKKRGQLLTLRLFDSEARELQRLALRDNHDFIQYQLIQRTRNTFELKLVTVDLPTFERTSADLLTRLQPLLGPEAQITHAYVSPHEPFGERKRIQLVSLVK